MKAIATILGSGFGLLLSITHLIAAGNTNEWCEYQQAGLMEIPVNMSISTDGKVTAVVGRSGGVVDGKSYRYETRLSQEERLYLSTLLNAIGFMNRQSGHPLLKDAGTVKLRVIDNGRTNSVYFDWLPDKSEWTPLGDFLSKLAYQAEGTRRLESGQSDCLADRWLQREKLVESLKKHLRATRRWESASATLQTLAKYMRPEEWTGLVALCFQEADEEKRNLLLIALTTNQIPLQQSLPGWHREKLQLLLKVLGESGPDALSKQTRRIERYYSTNKVAAPANSSR